MHVFKLGLVKKLIIVEENTYQITNFKSVGNNIRKHKRFDNTYAVQFTQKIINACNSINVEALQNIYKRIIRRAQLCMEIRKNTLNKFFVNNSFNILLGFKFTFLSLRILCKCNVFCCICDAFFFFYTC